MAAVAALVAALLAGCASSTSAPSVLRVEFGGSAPDVEATVVPEGLPAKRHYDDVGVPHLGHYTAFDQLAQWAAETGRTIDVEHASFGFFLCGIDGHPGRGAHAYWSLLVNGTASMVGMEGVRVAPGTAVTWRLEPSEYPNCPGPAPPAGNASAQPSIAAPEAAVTRAETVTLEGTATPGLAIVAAAEGVELARATASGDGAWTVALKGLQPGRTNVTFTAQGTPALVAATTRVVREVAVTLEARFQGYPGASDRSDVVWVDPDAALSSPAYAQRDVAHPGHLTVHDAMVAWQAQAGAQVVYTYSNGLGFAVSSIDGVGSPVATGLLSATWCYEVDGASADKGISLMPLAPGQTVTWTLGCAGM